jgi:hypothetical protein
MDTGFWLFGLLIIPGLFALALLMSWMETRLTQQIVVHDVNKAWLTAGTPEEVEEMVRRSAARLRIDRVQSVYSPHARGRA